MNHHDFAELGHSMDASSAAAWGTCSFSSLSMTEEQRTACHRLCPNAAGVIVAAFPYYNGDRGGNLSLYARGEDYHRCVTRYLNRCIRKLQECFPEKQFVAGSDNSPLPERQCARLAGVGIMGKNGLVIVPPYGSWVFLGTILTDLPLPDGETPSPDCLNCGACVRACPDGALSTHPFDEERCLSALTQKKGSLTAHQEELLRRHPLIWGCDLCQRVCPYNREAKNSPLDDLTGRGEIPYLSELTEGDMEGLTNRTFRETYGERAFAWRGPAVIRRNLALKKSK